MKELIKQLCDILKQNKDVVLVSVVSHQGSTPRGAGSKMLVNETGLLYGTIGGGLAEGECIAICPQILKDKKTKLMKFDLTGEIAAQSDMICGGKLDILLTPLNRKYDLIFYETLLSNISQNEVYAIHCTDEMGKTYHSLKSKNTWLAGKWDDIPISETEKNKLLDMLPKNQESFLFQDKYIIEKYISPWQVIILGGGHVSRPTAYLASTVGFDVTVIDDREEFSTSERFPTANMTYTIPDFIDCFKFIIPTVNTCIIIVTRGHLYDKTVLAQALKTKASYIGMIGSKRKKAEVYNALKLQGIEQNKLGTVHCPIGISINAETPEEIAVSIIAECIEHRRTL